MQPYRHPEVLGAKRRASKDDGPGASAVHSFRLAALAPQDDGRVSAGSSVQPQDDGTGASTRPDIGGANHRSQFLHFVSNEFAKIAGGQNKRLGAHRGQFLLDLRVAQATR